MSSDDIGAHLQLWDPYREVTHEVDNGCTTLWMPDRRMNVIVCDWVYSVRNGARVPINCNHWESPPRPQCRASRLPPASGWVPSARTLRSAGAPQRVRTSDPEHASRLVLRELTRG